MSEVALALIAIGQSKPDLIVNNKSPLIIACYWKLINVALELIETKLSNPDHVTLDGNTAFSFACDNYLKPVAMKLIELEFATLEDLFKKKPEWILYDIKFEPIDVDSIDI